MNILTATERSNRECARSCPQPRPDGFPEDGDAVQCQHGRWFVADVCNAVFGGRKASWRRARLWEMWRIKKALKETR